jgi:hypothetical protein
MKIDITKVNPPGAGKKLGTVLTSEGRIYGFWPDKVHPMIGPAEVTTASRDFQGQLYWTIVTYKPSEPSETRVIAVREVSTPSQLSPRFETRNESAPWWMAFVSNTVAHAIEAGLIKLPNDMIGWAIAAKETAANLANPQEDEADKEEDIPF